MTMPKKVAIVQSSYLPWKGSFDLVTAVDEFILYDDMQHPRRDWRNRNRIKTYQGTQRWLCDHGGYREHTQLSGTFTRGAAVSDLLFNCGRDAPDYMRYVRA